MAKTDFHPRYRNSSVKASPPSDAVHAPLTSDLKRIYIANIQIRDPQAAEKFYKALVWRNPNMPYAQEANKKRWFPSTPPE